MSKSRESLKWVMRAGYGARGVIYATVGGLAFWAAFTADQAAGTKDALATLRSAPLGVLALWIIGLGLLAYTLWRVVAGVFDVEDHGTGARGLVARTGQVVTGLLHGAIGISVILLAISGGGNTDSSAEDWTQMLMSIPMGRTLVALAALVLLGAGLYYCKKGMRGEYKDHLRSTALTAQVAPILKAGLVIYGALIALVALSLGLAALRADPSQAGGLGQALGQLQRLSYGWVLLAGAGLGLLAFALYNFVEAKYRVVPRIDGPNVKTLAKEALN